MIALLQRVTRARVTVQANAIASIGPGLLVLAAVQPEDDAACAKRMAERIVNYRIFNDDQGRMNLNVGQTDGEILIVSQFTLAANTAKGNRPSFTRAADPPMARELFDRLVTELGQLHPRLQTGQFAADMQVELVNDGPVTIWLEVKGTAPGSNQ